MNAGKVLIGTAMLVFSLALMVTPSGAAQPDAVLPSGQEGLHANGMDPAGHPSPGTTGQAATGNECPSAIMNNATTLVIERMPRFKDQTCLLLDQLSATSFTPSTERCPA